MLFLSLLCQSAVDKRLSVKPEQGHLGNWQSADLDQMPQNAESDQGLHCFLELQEVKG